MSPIIAGLIDASVAARRKQEQARGIAVAERFAQQFGITPLQAYDCYVKTLDGFVLVESNPSVFHLVGRCPRCRRLAPSAPVTLASVAVIAEWFAPWEELHRCGDSERPLEIPRPLLSEPLQIPGEGMPDVPAAAPHA